jgi:uncharacterized protein YneF (UPF0154 family)
MSVIIVVMLVLQVLAIGIIVGRFLERNEE